MVNGGTGRHNCGAVGGCSVLEQPSAHFCKILFVWRLVRRNRKVHAKCTYGFKWYEKCISQSDTCAIRHCHSSQQNEETSRCSDAIGGMKVKQSMILRFDLDNNLAGAGGRDRINKQARRPREQTNKKNSIGIFLAVANTRPRSQNHRSQLITRCMGKPCSRAHFVVFGALYVMPDKKKIKKRECKHTEERKENCYHHYH